ncbi:hypothetical protein [Dokdonella sp.]|uniref:hypothetical protein n=1 Tax=Dokdonella sp. TaxID=2291710 RepID=UPI0037848BEF
MKIPSSLLPLAFMALATSAHAEIYCVADGTILQLALQASAQSPAVNDSIRLEAGTYRSTSPNGFYATFGDSNTGNLDISGGWSPGCQIRLPGRRSTIDGEFARPGMHLYGTLFLHGRVRITNLEFVRGRATSQNISGGLTVNRGYDIEIESNVFSDNALDHANSTAGAGLFAISEGAISVRNNLFVRNDADTPISIAAGGAVVYCYGSGNVGRFINNTVYDNTADAGAAGDVGGVYVGGEPACGWDVANNSLWGNPGLDLSLGSASVNVRYNDLQNRGGTETPSTSSGNFSASPQFLSATDFRVKRSSPLVDAGLNAAGGGVTGGSLDGGPRLVGPHVDIGAYELDRLFADGFDPVSP